MADLGISEWKIFQSTLTVNADQDKCTPQDSINELIIWKVNPLVVPVTSVKLKLAFLHAQWQGIFYENFPVSGKIKHL